MIKKTILFLSIFSAISTTKIAAQEVYPTHWWAGMKTRSLQLLIKTGDPDFGKGRITTSYPGVSAKRLHTFANRSYLAIDIELSASVKPGTVYLMYERNGKKTPIPWSLKARTGIPGKDFARGLSGKDMVYLLMPDRFSNGDASNDRVPWMRDQSLDRKNYYARHGGDFQGVINHLGYLQDMGVTAVWMTPVLENDMPDRTEHGYAITHHYRIDPRYGGERMYRVLRDSLTRRGMKLVQDAVYNHTGTFHNIVQDLPDRDWLNQWPQFTSTSAREQALFDPYASEADKKRMSDGWFVKEMPDWNQRNPYVANFLTQHAIWYIEEFGIDAVRLDTYMYNDLVFSNACNAALMAEYPALSLFGEVLVQHSPNQAYFAANNIATPFKSNLASLIDFQCLFNGIGPALTQEPGWYTGVVQLYNVISHDFLLKHPDRNVLLLDNHDLPRFFTRVNGDVARQRMAYTWLLTCRGIPQLYYGSEVLMAGDTKPDGLVRLDFPGGWPGDEKNGFTRQGLSEDERSMQQLVRQLGNFRKNSTAIQSGRFMHYAPHGGLYAYFRYNNIQTVMCVMNTSTKPVHIDFGYFSERTSGFNTATNVVTGSVLPLSQAAELPPLTMWVLELQK
ncbi:alpha-amylase family glycosyl hydrolase [Chitinophaga sp.]|uniref:alpha-amylase family glycosyl hydrolase n=1 Tax=Chitinophaga sp. TaxID=1869181 RepID=UPI0031CDD9DF